MVSQDQTQHHCNYWAITLLSLVFLGPALPGRGKWKQMKNKGNTRQDDIRISDLHTAGNKMII